MGSVIEMLPPPTGDATGSTGSASIAFYLEERDALRAGVAGMQEAFRQVQQMVQV